jgi:hypothetical protein
MTHSSIERFGSSSRYRWFQIITAILVYITAHIVDYFLTVYGIVTKTSQEANPVVQGYIDHFGVEKGLMICKSLMSIVIILGVIFAHLAYGGKQDKVKVEYILYVGSLFTFLGGVLWLIRF